MLIKIKSQFGYDRTYSFDVQLTTTVKEVKQLIREKINSSEDDLKNMYFTFETDILDKDEDTLQSYGVEDQSQLVLSYYGRTTRNLGAAGIRFADVSNTKGLQRREWSKTAPAWWRARRGLCLEGKCDNPNCEAYQQWVIMGIGYSKFDVLCDLDEVRTVCPMPNCRKFVQPENCSFNNCWWRFEGIKKDESGINRLPIKCSSEFSKVDDAYHRFEQPVTGTVTWLKLIIEVVKDKPT